MDQDSTGLIILRLDELSKQLRDLQSDFDKRIKEIEKWVEVQKYRMDDVILTRSDANKITAIWSLIVLVIGILGGAAGAELLGGG